MFGLMSLRFPDPKISRARSWLTDMDWGSPCNKALQLSNRRTGACALGPENQGEAPRWGMRQAGCSDPGHLQPHR